MIDSAGLSRAIRRFWPLVLAVAVISGLGAFGASFLQSPSYSATTQVLVLARDIRFLTSTGEGPGSRPGVLDLAQPKSVSQTLGGIATSRTVAEQVVRDLDLDKQAENESAGAGASLRRGLHAIQSFFQYGFYAEPSAFDGAVAQVQKSLEANPIKDSYLIEIKARASSAQKASQIANAATKAFIDQSKNNLQQDASTYRTFLEGELDRARSDVSDSETALASYKQQHGVTDVTEETKLAATAAETARQQLSGVDADLANSKAKRANLEKTLSTLSPTERTSTSGQQSTSPGGPTYPVVSDVTQQQEVVSPNPVYQEVQRSTLSLDADIVGLQAKHDALSAALASSSQNAGSLAEDTAQLSQLELQRTAAHSVFTSVQAEYETALMNEAQGAQEMRQIDQAATPIYPDRPMRHIFLAIGLLFGLAAGVGIARYLDSRSLEATAVAPIPWHGRALPQPAGVLSSTVQSRIEDATVPLEEARTVSRYEL